MKPSAGLKIEDLIKTNQIVSKSPPKLFLPPPLPPPTWVGFPSGSHSYLSNFHSMLSSFFTVEKKNHSRAGMSIFGKEFSQNFLQICTFFHIQ